MKIEFLRSATLIVHTGEHRILVDPMLADMGALPPFSIFRHEKRRNPLVPLPPKSEASLKSVTAALITHCKYGHADHLDRAGCRFLVANNLPTFCRADDSRYLARRHIDARALKLGEQNEFLGGSITPVRARHGHGWIAALMGPGVGYFIEMPGEPSLYIAGDTVMTDDVRRTLTRLRPDIAIVAAGNASVDIGKPILMSLDEVMEFARLAPGRVVANHLEALNHCPISRTQLREVSKRAGLEAKIEIPADGEVLHFEREIDDD